MSWVCAPHRRLCDRQAISHLSGVIGCNSGRLQKAIHLASVPSGVALMHDPRFQRECTAPECCILDTISLFEHAWLDAIGKSGHRLACTARLQPCTYSSHIRDSCFDQHFRTPQRAMTATELAIHAPGLWSTASELSSSRNAGIPLHNLPASQFTSRTDLRCILSFTYRA